MSREWPIFPPIPKPSEPLVDSRSGMMTREWYRYFSAVDSIVRGVPGFSLNDIANVDAPSPTNGQKLTYVTADAKWKGV